MGTVSSTYPNTEQWLEAYPDWVKPRLETFVQWCIDRHETHSIHRPHTITEASVKYSVALHSYAFTCKHCGWASSEVVMDNRLLLEPAQPPGW